MSFNWNEYFDLAQELTGQTTPIAGQEARCRCAISRAYYAAFVRARNHLRDVDLDPYVPTDGSAHGYVSRTFQKSRDRRRKLIGALLKSLRTERNLVDYEDIVPGLLTNTAKHLLLAKQVLTTLDKL